MVDNPCNECAIRLFNEKCYNIKGTGNPLLGNMIIISNIDNDSYKSNDLSFSEQVRLMNSLISSTGGCNLTEIAFVTPLIKCRESNCQADDNSIKCCLKNLANEFRQYKPQNVLVTGSAVNRFLDCSIHEYLDKVIISKNNIKYFVNYSPLIKYNDVNKFEIFKQHLEKWYNAINYNYFYNYEVVKL